MSKKPENKFKDVVCTDLLRLKNIWILRTHEVARRGIPDLIICLNGRFIAIELKTDETLRIPKHIEEYTLQDLTLMHIEKKGRGKAWKVAPKNWQPVYQVLQELDAGVRF